MNASILQRIAAGDSLAVEDCLNRYGGLVWSLAKRWIVNAADAEDVTQEIFVELWQQAGRFDPAVAGEATFVAMIARRRLIDRKRRESRRPSPEPILHDPIDEPAGRAGDVLEWQDEVVKAKRCLDKLGSQQRDVLRLTIHHGCSHSVISARLALPLGTVKSLSRRGLIQLRDCMRRAADASSMATPSQSLEPFATQGS